MRCNFTLAWRACLFLLVPLLFPTKFVLAQDEGNLFNTPTDVAMGGRYFQRQCTRCHGQDARGNEETGAPDLTTRGSQASTDAGIFAIIRQGISGTAMLPVPPETPDSTIWQLVAFINSLRTEPALVDVPGSVAAGAELFDSKGACRDCHMIGGSGGRQGPDLSRVGERLTPAQLRTSLTEPNSDVDPRWWTIRVTQRDGSTVEGLRMDEDSFSLRIIDANANLWSFSKEQIAGYERISDSSMPGYAQTLSSSEIEDLVAYLYSLRNAN
jgi:putative heme-binding domain-containing protein